MYTITLVHQSVCTNQVIIVVANPPTYIPTYHPPTHHTSHTGRFGNVSMASWSSGSGQHPHSPPHIDQHSIQAATYAASMGVA